MEVVFTGKWNPGVEPVWRRNDKGHITRCSGLSLVMSDDMGCVTTTSSLPNWVDKRQVIGERRHRIESHFNNNQEI